jgi:hypothetical protein
LLMITDFFIVVGIAILLALGLASLYLRDKLIEHQFQHHRDEWIRDGRPIGGRASGMESTFWQGRFARIVVESWVWKTPEWVKSDRKAERLLTIIRATWVAGFGLGALFLLRF